MKAFEEAGKVIKGVVDGTVSSVSNRASLKRLSNL